MDELVSYPWCHVCHQPPVQDGYLEVIEACLRHRMNERMNEWITGWAVLAPFLACCPPGHARALVLDPHKWAVPRPDGVNPATLSPALRPLCGVTSPRPTLTSPA